MKTYAAKLTFEAKDPSGPRDTELESIVFKGQAFFVRDEAELPIPCETSDADYETNRAEIIASYFDVILG